jgi:uncharacterized protein
MAQIRRGRANGGERCTVSVQTISRGEARAIALTAQGFARPRPKRPVSPDDIRGVMKRLGVLQLDAVNVFCRSHYMPLFSRLGPYDRSILDTMTAHTELDGDRELIEYWGHEASLLTPRVHSLLRWRAARADRESWNLIARLARERPDYIEETLALVTERGPIRASATGEVRAPAVRGEMWNWHDGKIALEYLFYAGRVSVAGRVKFERLYDLPERVLPPEALDASLSEDEAQRELVRVAAAALGIASEPDLGDYFRLTRADSKLRVAELVALDELVAVEVEGWSAPAYLWPAALVAKPVAARALLSPFDSLIWTRDRTQRIFDFTYRLEIYVPAAKRQYGYYVLPFLLGDTLVARVDLKSDRKARALLVQSAFSEPGIDVDYTVGELASELRDVACWLDLERVEVMPRGDLARPLARALVG